MQLGDFMSSHAVRPSLAELRQVSDKLLLWFDEIRQEPAEEKIANGAGHQDTLSALSLTYYRIRRSRDNYLPKQLFGEPAWDILLDLYINHTQARSVSVSSLCVASMVPATTALRYIAMLEDHGLLRKVPAEHDRRVSLVELTDKGSSAMEAYMSNIAMEIVNLLSARRKSLG